MSIKPKHFLPIGEVEVFLGIMLKNPPVGVPEKNNNYGKIHN
jgi:hypothetical protein